MEHLRLSHTEYENQPRLNRWVCSFVTATGRRFGEARDTFEEARAQAETWAAENGIPCRMKDVLAEQAAAQAAADCAAWRSELNRLHHDAIRHMGDVVCGKVEETPLRVAALPDLTFHPSLIAVPTIGGILDEDTVDPLHQKFPAGDFGCGGGQGLGRGALPRPGRCHDDSGGLREGSTGGPLLAAGFDRCQHSPRNRRDRRPLEQELIASLAQVF